MNHVFALTSGPDEKKPPLQAASRNGSGAVRRFSAITICIMPGRHRQLFNSHRFIAMLIAVTAIGPVSDAAWAQLTSSPPPAGVAQSVQYVYSNFVEAHRFDDAAGNLVLRADDAGLAVSLHGSMAMEVDYDGFSRKDARDDDTPADGLEEVLVEMTSLRLSGHDAALGRVALHLVPDALSLGLLEEASNDYPGTLELPAQLYVDAFIEVSLLDGEKRYHSAAPVHLVLAGGLDTLPAGTGDTLVMEGPVTLAGVDGTVGNLTLVQLTVTPAAGHDGQPLSAARDDALPSGDR